MTSAPYDLAIDSGGDQFPVAGLAPRLSWKDPVGAGGEDGFKVKAMVDAVSEVDVDLPAGARGILVLPDGSERELAPGRVTATTTTGVLA
jgi:alpha-L-rhamnosidase